MNSKVISRERLLSNLEYVKSFNKKVCAMVKANAYGNGYKNIVKILNNKVEFFGVANIDEAMNIRKYTTNKILIVGKTLSYEKAILNNIHLTVDTMCDLQQIDKVAKKNNKQAYVHIKVNSGMNRLGVKTMTEFNEMLEYISSSKNIVLYGLYTHFFDAENKTNNVYTQLKNFYKYVKLTNDKVLIHIGGSFALKHKLPEWISMIRAGIVLYGYGSKYVKPIMKIESTIIKIIDCKKGEKIGYGNNILKNDTKIAIVPVGYFDGFCRQLKNGYFFKINNFFAKIIGNICMDMTAVDISNISCRVGDSVLCYENALNIKKITKQSEYEILTNFSSFRGKNLIV